MNWKQRIICCTFFSVFFAPFSQKNSLDNTTFLCYPQLCKKGFLLKLLLVAFFLPFFFCGCLAKVFLRQRVKKIYCSSDRNVKCVCISIFSFLTTQKVVVIHSDNTKSRSYSFWQHKKWYLSKKRFFAEIVLIASFVFFLSFFSVGCLCFLAKVLWCQSENKNYCGYNTKVKWKQKERSSQWSRHFLCYQSVFFAEIVLLKGKRVIKWAFFG